MSRTSFIRNRPLRRLSRTLVGRPRLGDEVIDQSFPRPLFDLPLANDAGDVSGNDYHATLEEGAMISGGALACNGLSGYAQLPVGVSGVAGGWALSCMIKTAETSPCAFFAQKDPQGLYAAGLHILFGQAGVAAGGGDGVWAGPDIQDDAWHHLLGSQEADGSMHLWLDGVKIIDTFESDVRDNVAGDNLRLGAFLAFGEYFTGLIKKAKGWRMPLTAAQAAAIYAYDTTP